MKAAQIHRYGGHEVVEINNNALDPMAGPGRVLVQVYAAGVNPIDWKMREGWVKDRVPLDFPITLGGDFAGVVKDTGEEVYGQAGMLNNGSGSFAEFAVADINKIAPRPDALHYVQTAAVPLAATSAWQGIAEYIQAAPVKKVLIHGGAGGIGAAAIQIAKHLGVYVATTVATADMQYAQELGADQVINYQSQRFEELLQEYDAVFDASGSGAETYEKSFGIVKRGGIVVSMTEQPNNELARQYGATTMRQSTDVTRERLEKITQLIDQGVLKLQVDRVFPLEQAADALSYLQTNHSRGKVVVQIKNS